MIRRLAWLLVFFGLTICSWAQENDCELTLGQATEEFNAGRFYSIPGILKPCIDRGFSREQKQRAFLLLTQTYLLLDDPIGAETSYLQVLMANPEFIADNERHPMDVVYLSKKFTAAPIFSWFGKLGVNVSPISVIRDIDAVDNNKEKYTWKPGLQFGAGGEYHYDEKFSMAAEVNFALTSYKNETYNYFGRDTKEIIDRQTWLMIPIAVKYTHPIGKYRPFGYVGYSTNVLLSDVANINIVNHDPSNSQEGEEILTDKESPNLNFKHRRNTWNSSVMIGGGIKYKFGLDFIFIDVRYNLGLTNIVKEDGLYGNYKFDAASNAFVESFEATSAYAHVDDYFRLNNLSISFGFVRPLYKPRELKKAKTKSVLRKIKKDE
ncbi:MAG: porin family protein [Bacteroidota bacterium]